MNAVRASASCRVTVGLRIWLSGTTPPGSRKCASCQFQVVCGGLRALMMSWCLVFAPSLSSAGPSVPPRPPSLWHDPQLRSEEHTSELQSRFDLVCRLLLEKKKKKRRHSSKKEKKNKNTSLSQQYQLH